jgi:hypothetical protein
MDIIINTIQGTFVVPQHKQQELIQWLINNTVKVGQEPVREQFQSNGTGYTGRQLLSEDLGREF